MLEGRFLVVAALLHGMVPVAAAIAPEPPPSVWTLGRPQDTTEIEFDVDTAFIPPPRNQPPVDSQPLFPPPPNAAGQPAGAPRIAARVPGDGGGAPPPVASGAILTAPEDSGPPDASALSPDGADDPLGRAPNPFEVGDGIAPGLGGTPYWAYTPGGLPDGPGPDSNPAPTQAPKRKFDKESGTRATQDAMRKEDAKLGLDFPGRGPIRNAFVGATYASDAPYTCSASFSVSVSPSGKVTDVSLVGFNGGSAATWEGVRRAAKATLAGATLVMKSAFAKGATVGVMVKSIKKSPSGGDGITRDGATGSFDIADIGARDTRVVTAGVNPQPVR